METIAGAQIFDGTGLKDGWSVSFDATEILRLGPANEGPAPTIRLNGGIVSAAFVDLQVNGGAGRMIGGDTDLDDLTAICAAHLRLGTGGLLATLISDRPDVTARITALAQCAQRQRVPGFLGLHLEGPHLDPRRNGAHDPSHIRPMTDADLQHLLDARNGLDHFKVTVAPEAVTGSQIAAMAQAGILVSLGHSDCSLEAARAAISAGAGCGTHLFNAMGGISARAPGLAGAILADDLPCGIIADGLHVVPEMLKIALAAKTDGLFLVTDSMAFAGSDITRITLNHRLVLRDQGRLTLEDGTLAGADLTMAQAIQVIRGAGASLERALRMATSLPADVIGAMDRGRIAPGMRADLVHLTDDLVVDKIWNDGTILQ